MEIPCFCYLPELSTEFEKRENPTFKIISQWEYLPKNTGQNSHLQSILLGSAASLWLMNFLEMHHPRLKVLFGPGSRGGSEENPYCRPLSCWCLPAVLDLQVHGSNLCLCDLMTQMFGWGQQFLLRLGLQGILTRSEAWVPFSRTLLLNMWSEI